MRSLRFGPLARALVTLLLLSVPAACGKNKPAEAGDAKADEGEAPAAEAGPPPADLGKMASGSGGAAGETGGSGGSGGGTAAPAGAEAGSGSGGAGATSGGDTGAEAEGESSTGGANTSELLEEVTRTRTKDDRALEALTEAEAAGVEARELAKAANTRGEKLHATPERAKAFFEWANAKDETYPVAAFNLAKQAAVLGELEEAKKWLAVVKERKGKKLLQQVDFDPMWEILKDDPDVRALLK